MSDKHNGNGDKLVVASAIRMSEDARGQWATALRARFGEGVRLSIDEAPDLLGGVELRFPHSILSFTVANRLSRAAESMEG